MLSDNELSSRNGWSEARRMAGDGGDGEWSAVAAPRASAQSASVRGIAGARSAGCSARSAGHLLGAPIQRGYILIGFSEGSALAFSMISPLLAKSLIRRSAAILCAGYIIGCRSVCKPAPNSGRDKNSPLSSTDSGVYCGAKVAVKVQFSIVHQKTTHLQRLPGSVLCSCPSRVSAISWECHFFHPCWQKQHCSTMQKQGNPFPWTVPHWVQNQMLDMFNPVRWLFLCTKPWYIERNGNTCSISRNDTCRQPSFFYDSSFHSSKKPVWIRTSIQMKYSWATRKVGRTSHDLQNSVSSFR